MNDNLKKALEFYKLDSNYSKKNLRDKRNQYIKENTNIVPDIFQELINANDYYKLLLTQIFDNDELFHEEAFDFERRLVFYTKPNGKFNDLSEKYLIKLQHVDDIEELHNLENSYYEELKFVLGMNKKKRKRKKEKNKDKDKKNVKKKDYLEQEKNNFDSYLETEKLEATLKETREIVDRYRKDLKRIENLKDMLKLEENYKIEVSNLKQEKEVILLKNRKYDLQNTLTLILDIPNNNMFQSLLKKYQELINKANSFKELDSIYEEFLKEYGTLSNKNIKYIKELKQMAKQILAGRLKKNAKDDPIALDLFRELCFKIDALEENKIYEMLPLIDKVYFNNLVEDKQVVKELGVIIYVHKYNGDIVSLIDMNNNNVKFYSLMKHTYFDMPKDRFEYNFISLKSFLKRAEYVGDKNVRLVSNGEKIEIKFPNQEFIYYYDGIMLSFEHGQAEHDNFYFYPDTSFKLPQGATWEYDPKTSKYGPAADIFANKEYTYETIIQNMESRLESELEDNNSKKR